MYKNIYEYSRKIKSLITFKLLMLIMSKVGDDNKVILTKGDMEIFLESCDCKRVSWYRGLTELEDLGMIEKLNTGLFRANPKVFWSADTKERLNLILAESQNEVLKELTPIEGEVIS